MFVSLFVQCTYIFVNLFLFVFVVFFQAKIQTISYLCFVLFSSRKHWWCTKTKGFLFLLSWCPKIAWCYACLQIIFYGEQVQNRNGVKNTIDKIDVKRHIRARIWERHKCERYAEKIYPNINRDENTKKIPGEDLSEYKKRDENTKR